MSNFLNTIRNIFEYKEEQSYDFVLLDTPVEQQTTDFYSTITEKVSTVCDKNIEFIKDKYSALINSDIKIREFYLNVQNKQYKSFIFYIDGMINADSINHFVLNPLMLKNKSNTDTSKDQVLTAPDKVTIVREPDIQ